jgi:hypothetical protein
MLSSVIASASEAIQLSRNKAGLLRRFAPCNDEPYRKNNPLIDVDASSIIEL